MQTDKVFTRKEYIEREAAIVAIKSLYPGIPLAKIRLQKWHEKNKNFMECEMALERISAANVAPVRHGKWVKATGMMPPEYCGLHICSECGHYAGRKPPYGGKEMLSDYCPNCGAKMDGTKNE